MAIRALAPEQVAATQARLREELAPALAPTVANLEAVERVAASGRFQYRGVLYDVPPVSYVDGVTLQKCQNTIVRLAKSLDATPYGLEDDDVTAPQLRELLTAFEVALFTMWRLARPVGWFDRLTWRWRSNPFANATTEEVGELLAFFSQRRTTSTVRRTGWETQGRALSPAPSAASAPSTSLTISRGSSTASPGGSGLTGSRRAIRRT